MKTPPLQGSLVVAKRFLLAGSLVASASLSAEVITLLPPAIHGNDTTTASFTNGDITLTPTRGGVSTGVTFNANPTRLGIDGFDGSNPNAFSEPDDVFGSADDEGLIFDFASNAGLTQIAFDFATFGGTNPTDGLRISGFTSDPQATLTGFGAAAAGTSLTFADGVLTLLFPASFGGADTFINLGSPLASAGQQLVMTIGDSLPAAAQLPILSISYEDSDLDQDGVDDAVEIGLGGDPTLFDTDNDGFSDGAEFVDGTLLNDPSSNGAGPLSDRNSIGVTFTASNGQAPGRTLSPLFPAGAPGFVQTNWNSTVALPPTGTYSQADIATPVAGGLVDNNGVDTGTTFVTSVFGQPGVLNRVFSANNDAGRPIGGLFSGFVFTEATTPFIDIELGNVPYPRYDLVIYGITSSGNPVENALLAAFNGGDDRAGEFTLSAAPRILAGTTSGLIQSRDQSNSVTQRGTATENFPVANFVVIRGLTDPNPVISLSFRTGNFGIPAFQIVDAPDSDGDGLGDAYELSVGLDPNDNGSINSQLQGAAGDLDGDGLTNLQESNNETNPGEPDSDFDGLNDSAELDTANFVSLTNRGTDPNIADTDSDGLSDFVETNTGVFVGLGDTGTNPVNAVADSDGDAFPDNFEVLSDSDEQSFDPFDPDLPGGPNPNGFAVAFNASAGQAGAADIEFPGTVYIGAPGVEQRNWNRTIPQGGNVATAGQLVTFGSENIATPVAGQLIDSSGAPLTGVDFSYAPGSGFFAINNSGIQQSGSRTFVGPFGRLFNSYGFGSSAATAATTQSRVTFDNVPYAVYDAYVYFGAFGAVPGNVSNFDADGNVIQTFNYTTTRAQLATSQFLLTEATEGNPAANYAVFRNLTSPNLDVRTDFGGAGTNTASNIGIFGVQVVEQVVDNGLDLVLGNVARVGDVFSASLTTSLSGTFQLQRSLTLQDGFVNVGNVFTASAGQTVNVTDPSSPAGRAFYRVIQVSDAAQPQ